MNFGSIQSELQQLRSEGRLVLPPKTVEGTPDQSPNDASSSPPRDPSGQGPFLLMRQLVARFRQMAHQVDDLTATNLRLESEFYSPESLHEKLWRIQPCDQSFVGLKA